MRKALLLLLPLAVLVLVAGCSDDGASPSAAAQPQPPTCPAAWKAGWKRLANRVNAPVYCPSWMPSPLDGKIGGDWDNGVSVDSAHNYLVSFLWQSCLSLAASKVFLVAERFESGPKSSARRGKSARQWGALAHVGFEPEAGIADP